MQTVAAPHKAAKLNAQPRGVPSILKRHALRCRPVAFKEENRADSAMEDLKKRVNELQGSHKVTEGVTDKVTQNVTGVVSDLKTTLGKPVMSSAVKVPRWMPAFTRRREVFVGRLGMLGFFAACLWETYLPSHPGIVMQVSQFLGVPPSASAALFGAIILYNLAGAAGPWSPTFSEANQRDAFKHPEAAPTVFDWRNFFGIDGWGFTKKNEVFNGRLAMLGFFAALFNEWRLGWSAGPLAQVAYYLHMTPDDAFYGGVGKLLWGFTFLAVAISILDGNVGNVEGEEDIY